MQYTRKHLESNLADLKAMVVEMGSRAERMLGNAVVAVVNGDQNAAREVIDADDLLDRMELEIHSTWLIGAIMAIAGELERIGDDAVSIAKKAISLPGDFPREYRDDILGMSEKSRSMLMSMLEAFTKEDLETLDSIIAADAEVDMIWKSVRRRIKDQIRSNPEFVDTGLKLIQACHHLEYASDHVVAIAERLEFLRTGNLVRFSRAQY
jgi:phosphate transport system protein